MKNHTVTGHSSAAKAELEENALQEFESLKAFEGLHVVESEWPDIAKFAQSKSLLLCYEFTSDIMLVVSLQFSYGLLLKMHCTYRI